MDNEMSVTNSQEEIIAIPSFLSYTLSNDVSTTACEYCEVAVQCTGGCQGEQCYECYTLIMQCGFKESDCTSTQACGNAECGECDACQTLGMCSTCEDTCMTTCEVRSQGGGGCRDTCELASQESPIDVDYWSWTSSNGSASSSRTKAAYDAVRSNGAVSDFNYLVWNDLVDKILEVKQYAGFPWNAYFDLYENTLMTEDDRTLTALRFNSARYNIGIHISTGIETVKRGDDVIGDYFITIADCINEFIDSLAEE